MNHRSLLSFPLAIAGLLVAQSVSAEDLIKIGFSEDAGKLVANQGSLPDAMIEKGNRPSPRLMVPGVGGKDFALRFTNEQTGRPDYFQALEIESTALDHLDQWTLAMWVKLDERKYNMKNNVAKRTTAFATKATLAPDTNAGIYVGVNQGAHGPQIELKLGDGLSGATGYFNFKPRDNIQDGAWTFIAVTFDGRKSSNKVILYGADENFAVNTMTKTGKFDSVSGTGTSTEGYVSIGDGMAGFGPFSSLNGLVDEVYFSSRVLSKSELEAMRTDALY